MAALDRLEVVAIWPEERLRKLHLPRTEDRPESGASSFFSFAQSYVSFRLEIMVGRVELRLAVSITFPNFAKLFDPTYDG